MKVTGGAANLINGVSRQAPDVRLTTQLQESVNQWPTVSRGLVKRNPAVRLGGLPALRPDTLIHIIERDTSERYVAEIGSEAIRLWDLEGNEKVVNAPGGFGYLSAAGEHDFQAVTVADHTFILNKSVVVRKDPAKTPAGKQQALVHLVQGAFHTTYTVKIDDSIVAQARMGGGPYGDDADARDIERFAKTDSLAEALRSARTALGETLPDQYDKMQVPLHMRDSPAGVPGTMSTTDWGVSRYGNVLHIVNRGGNSFEIEASATDPNLIRAYKGTAPIYSELPRQAPNGFVLKINGDESSDHDDYYVMFDKPAGTAAGRWKETHAPDTQLRLDAATLPHLLVREADGTFTFKPGPWEDRKIGDDTTCPWPSFVDKRIGGIIYAQNRLGIFSGESVAMSRHNSYYDFFRESLLSRLDTDPVDLTIAHPEVSTILQAVPMGDEIVLFTTSVQFRLSADGARLTNDNGSIRPILSTAARAKAAPVSLGSRLYFANDAESGAFVTEFLYDREGGMKADEDITAHVQGYLPGSVDYLCGDKDLRTLALVGGDRPDELYIYRWMTSGTERVQSAWQVWKIPSVDAIKAMRVIGEELVLVAVLATGTETLAINLHEGWRQGFHSPVYLDRLVLLSGTYSPAFDQTTFTVPYSGADTIFDASPTSFGRDTVPTWDAGGDVFTLPGDWTGKAVFAGLSYESYGVLSPLLYRTTNSQGAYGNAVPGVDTWVSSIAFGSPDTAFLEVDVLRRYRPPYRQVLTPTAVSTDTGIVGSQQSGRVSQTVSVMARTEDVSIKFGTTAPHPYSITGLTWSGNATPKTL